VCYYFNLQAVTVAIELIRIFCIQGAPMILQSDNGWEFVAAVIVEVMALWPNVVIVHGWPRHPQSQGSVERANQDAEAMLGNWMSDNKTKNWVLGLNFVQLAKNTRNHSGVGNCPYTLQYGQRCRHGCAALPIDKALLSTLHTEDDLMDVLQSINFITNEPRHETDANNHIKPQEAPQATKADCIEPTEADCVERTKADCIEPTEAIEPEKNDAEHNHIHPQEAPQATEDDSVSQVVETKPSELDEDDMELANLLSSPNEQSKENQPPGDHDTPGHGNLRMLASMSQKQ